MRCQGLLLFLLTISLPAAASTMSIGTLDRDSDGRLSGHELAASGLFQRWDADADGQLHAKEFRAGSTRYGDWDVDGNMRLTEDEFYRGAFSYLDRDDDGSVDEEEFAVVSNWR